MSKNVALFVDVANLYYSARGQDVDVDYVALLKHATKGRDLIRAYAYSGLDPENENQRKFIDFLGKNGYKVVHKDIRKFGDGRMKANLDIELVVDLFRLANRMDIAVIVSGDGDFAPAMRALQEGGVRCEVISFRPNTSSDLIAVADEFTDIMKIASIERSKGSRGMSIPEMPAKEVNPEFGFREASAGVAAAALAAIRGGGETATSGRPRRTRTSRAKTTEKAAQEPAAEGTAEAAPAAVAETEGTSEGEGSRRRRRRRGGRGRGRGRRGEGSSSEAQASAAEPGASDGEELGWQEFDDLSQLGDLTDLGDVGKEREYAFSEADPATLAELGLPDSGSAGAAPAATEDAEPAAEAKAAAPARRSSARRTRATKSAAPADEGTEEPPAPEATAEPKPSTTRRRRSAARPADDAAPPADEPTATPRRTTRRAATTARSTSTRKRSSSKRSTAAAEAEAPASDEPADAAPGASPRRTTRRASRSSADAGSGAEAQEESGSAEPGDIWQRFRSGRRSKGAS